MNAILVAHIPIIFGAVLFVLARRQRKALPIATPPEPPETKTDAPRKKERPIQRELEHGVLTPVPGESEMKQLDEDLKAKKWQGKLFRPKLVGSKEENKS